MPKGISGSGGVDSSALDGLINQLNNILDKQNEINATKVSPKADDKGLKPITKTLEEIRNEAKNTSRTNIELWNTKALKKQIGEAKKILDDSLKSFDISKISSENISGFEKEFLNAFATIKTYSEKYGQEIASEYQNMFDAIFNKSDVFKQDDLQALFQRNINAALSNVKKGSFDIKYEADENWAKEQYKVYEQQAQIAKETANAVKQAEREKQEALMDTRDKILEETKTQLQQIKDMSADNKFLEIDDEQWARFQKSAGDMIQTLSEMGVEVRDLEDIFESLSKKIYIPKDQFASLKQGSITENVVGDVSEIDRAEEKIHELYNEIKSTGGTGGEGLSEEMSKGFNSEELTSFLNVLERIEQQLKNISATLGTVDENSGFNNMISSMDILLSKLDKMRQKIGTGIYNVEIKQGENFGSTSDLLISNERDKLMQSYNKIVKAFGDEEKLFSTMGSVLSRSSGLGSSSDDLFGLFSKDAVASINNPMEQINRIREFLIRFKEVRSELRQEVELLNKDLEYAQDNLKNISNKDEKNDVKNSIKNIKQQLKATSELSQTIDKLSTPSSTNAYLNKKIDSANESEKEFIQKMHEMDSVDLSGVIAQLENIAQILTEISQKDLFGDSLFKVSSQLDEIAAKFDNIVANVKVINEEPILTSNQIPLSSNTDDIDKATNAIKEEGEVAKKSAEQKEEFVSANKKVAESGLETAESINRATTAIKEEGTAISENKIDVNQFESMIKISDKLKEHLGGVVDVYKQVQKGADNSNKISYRVVGENGYAWVGANGDILKQNIKTSEQFTKQKNDEKNAIKEATQAQREYESLLAKRSTEIGNLNSAIILDNEAGIKGSTERINALNKEIEALERKGNIDKDVAENNLKYINAVTKSEEKQAKAEAAVAAERKKTQSLQIQTTKNFSLWLDKNSKAAKAYSVEIEAIFNRLKNSGDLSADELRNVQNEINNLMATAAREGNTGISFVDTLKQRFKSLAAYISTFASFYDIIRYVREGINVVKEYDTAFTEMRKVSDESVSSLKDYASTTFEVGDSVGATALTIQNSTADWLRLGEAIEDASESAKVSNILLNVSEFENINEATEALVSASQAYKDLDKIEIVDKLNNIGNNFSISTDKLAQGLQNTAAVLQTQGNDIDEAIALLTAANSQVQDISKASMGVRTISLRIASTEEAKDELAELGEDVDDFIVQTRSKTQKLIKDYTAVASNAYKGVDVLDANGNLRDTYEILLDISKIYKEIQEEDKKAGTNRANALVEYIAGKNRSNIAASILNAPDLLEQVYQASQKSEGSAQAELDKYLDSVQGKLTQTTNKMQEFANIVINSDSLKTMLDLLNGILDVINDIAATPLAPILLGTGVGAVGFIKNLDQPTFLVA